MKTIKIFLASSEELDYDRMAFGNLVRRLDDIYEKRGIRIKLFEWEDYDSAYNDKRKQDEYNEYVKQSDIFLALFHKKAGQFTIEEFDKASEQFKATASPKVYTYCKDLKPGEEESSELKEFKERLFNELGHYWCRYDNRESLQFQFVMQLQLVESNRMDDVKVEDGVVTVNGLPVAKMENLKFAAANEDYLRMQSEIQELRKEIIGMQIELEEKQKALDAIKETPNNETLYKYIKNDVDNLIDKLQPKLNKYNKLKKDFAKHQQFLFDAAKRVAQLQGELINDRIRRAIDALNAGNVIEANTILNEAEEDAQNLLNDYRRSKDITEQKRQNLFMSIKELSLKATAIMADASILIDDRVKQAEDIYELADGIAQEINYNQEKYIDFLFKYSNFLDNFDHNSMEVNNRLMKLCYELYGKNHPCTARSYDKIGYEYIKQGNYVKALLYFKEALTIRNNILEKDHPDIAISYHYIGLTYHMYKDYDKALEFYKQALDIRERVLGKEHLDTATSYEEIGDIYDDRHNYEKALEYYNSALVIREKALGREHPKTALTLLRISSIYNILDNSKRSMEFRKKSIPIITKHYTKDYPSGPAVLHFLAILNSSIMNHEKTIDLLLKAAEKGDKHNSNVLAQAYIKMDKYEEALKWAEKAKAEGDCDTDTLSTIYLHLNRYGDALKQFVLSLREKKKQQKYYIKKRLNTDELDKKIHETEKKIAALKELMKNGGVPEQ